MFHKLSAALLAVCLLASCGGGGGGGGGSSSSSGGGSTPTPGAFTLGANSATLTGVENGTLPAATSVPLTITGSNVAVVGAAYLNGQTQPSWLGINITGSGANYSLVVSILSTAIQPGQYSSTFSVGTADSGGNVLRTATFTVNYTVTPAPGGFNLSSNLATLTASQFGPVPTPTSIDASITGNSVASMSTAYTNGQSQPAWLGISVTGQGNNYSVALAILTTNLAPGQYTSTFAVRSHGANGGVLSSRDVMVTYTVTPPTIDGGFTLSSSQLNFAAVLSATTPSAQTVTVSQRGVDVASMSTTVLTGPTWLNASVSGDVVTISVAAPSAIGGMNGTVVISSKDAQGTVLQSKSVNVSYSVQQRLEISGSSTAHTFTHGHPVTTQGHPLNVMAPGTRQWRLSSNQTWLRVPNIARTGTEAVDAVVDVATLTPGTYHGEITVTNTADPLDNAVHTVNVTVIDPLITILQTSMLLGGDDGLTNVAKPLTFELNTSTSTYPFTVELTTDDGGHWLKANATTGSVGASGASVQISADAAGLVGGTYTGELKVTATVRGVAVSELLPVTFNLEASRLVVDAAGVAFSSLPLPARSVLSRNVKVLSSLQRTNVPWQASSDQAWLTVTASGMTGGTLALSANPAGLAVNTTHFATVTVSSSDTAVENVETIRVGLHVTNVAPTNFSMSRAAAYIATSAVEPIVFVTDYGPDVAGYNIYTGTKVRDFPGVVAAAGKLVLSDDGRRLFVYDTTNLRVVELDATTGGFVRSYNSSALYGTTPNSGLAYFRPDGYPTLITPSSRMYDVNGAAIYVSQDFTVPLYSLALDVSADNRYVVSHSGSVYGMKRTALNGGGLTSKYLFSTSTAQGRDGEACISQDNSIIYTASGYPYDFPGTSFATGQVVQRLPGSNYPSSILCLWNGVVIGGIDGYYNATDIWVYNGVTGVELLQTSSSDQGTYRSLHDRGLAASGDATRLISISGAYGAATSEVRFQSIPAP